MKKVLIATVIMALMLTVSGCTSDTANADASYVKDGDDIHIVKDGAELKDMTIEGDLYIDESVGEGEYTLENIVIKGTLYVNGSGQNSGHLISVQGTRLIVSSKTNPRIVCDMDTSFEGVQIASDCIIETESENINNVTVNNSETQEAINVTMKGTFPKVTLESTANVTLEGNISLMSVLKNAGLTDINMVDDSKMYFFSTYGKSVTIHGGTIIEAWINAEDCSLPENVDKIGSEVGVANVNIGDVTYTIPKSAPENGSDDTTSGEDSDDSTNSILLDGYPKVSSNGVNITISVAGYEKCKVYALVETEQIGKKGTTPQKVKDGISAGSGMKMPDGGKYIVIHKSFSVNAILNECSGTINMNYYMDTQSGGDNEDNPGPPDDASGGGNYIFVVVEDSKGNLSKVYQFIK